MTFRLSCKSGLSTAASRKKAAHFPPAAGLLTGWRTSSLAVRLVDVAILFDSTAGYRRNLFKISGRLAVNIADPLFLDQILRDCRLLYGKAPDLAELKMYAFKRYQDHKRYLTLEREYVHRVVSRLTA